MRRKRNTGRPSPKCIDCHEEDDTHQGRLGKKCKDCHSEKTLVARRVTTTTRRTFRLKDAHKKTGCTNCHPNERYEATPKDCYSCHLLNDVHRGDTARNVRTAIMKKSGISKSSTTTRPTIRLSSSIRRSSATRVTRSRSTARVRGKN